ncbi:MAG: glycosyltransferase family 2 protein [Chthoniobacterales bacterium]|nr:glycosyltransferase family 2 protein [Chthoniobacterales bacterium]
MIQPEISVLLPVFNEILYINRCLDSLLSQREEGLEICLSDNCSDDGTWEVVQEYAGRHPQIRAIRHAEPIHPYDNFLSALARAKGRYVYVIGGDDYLLPDALRDALATYREHPDLNAYLFRMHYFYDDTGEIFATFPPPEFQEKLNSSRDGLLRLFTGNVNHDELILGVFRTPDLVRTVEIIQRSSIEAAGLWMFLSLVLHAIRGAPHVLISKNPCLMKRYGKPDEHNCKSIKSAQKMETVGSLFQVFERVLEFRKCRGSLVNILNLRRRKLISTGEAIYLMTVPRYHSDYGLCYLGPIFHPLWRLIRAMVWMGSALKARLFPARMG